MAALAIGLGVGATTTMFSITRGVLRDLPFDEADRIIAMELENPQRGLQGRGLTADEILAWRSEQHTLEGLAAYVQGNPDLSGEGLRAFRRTSAAVTLNTFSVLRVQPLLGRVWTEADLLETRPGILLSYNLWESEFGFDPEIIGRDIELSGTTRRILGVMPDGFRFPSNQDIWEPLDLSQGGTARYFVFGRLADGVSLEAARTEFQGLEARNAISNPDVHEGMILRFDHFIAIQFRPAAEVKVVFSVMLLIVSFVLLIACANVANLLLARAAGMSRESAIRVALGASRRRVVVRFLIDATIIATLGGFLGVALAYFGVEWFDSRIGADVGRFWIRFAVDRTVLLFTLALVCGAGLVAGVLPGLRASHADVGSVLKAQPGRGGLRLGRASRVLIGGEVALSCALLLLAGLIVKGVAVQMDRNVGFETTDLVSVRVTLRNEAYPDRELRTRYFAQAIDALQALPDIELAAVASNLPGNLIGDVRAISLEGEEYGDGRAPSASVTATSSNLLETLGLRVTRGRDLMATDGPGAERVALVSESFAAKRFPERSDTRIADRAPRHAKRRRRMGDGLAHDCGCGARRGHRARWPGVRRSGDGACRAALHARYVDRGQGARRCLGSDPRHPRRAPGPRRHGLTRRCASSGRDNPRLHRGGAHLRFPLHGLRRDRAPARERWTLRGGGVCGESGRARGRDPHRARGAVRKNRGPLPSPKPDAGGDRGRCRLGYRSALRASHG